MASQSATSFSKVWIFLSNLTSNCVLSKCKTLFIFYSRKKIQKLSFSQPSCFIRCAFFWLHSAHLSSLNWPSTVLINITHTFFLFFCYLFYCLICLCCSNLAGVIGTDSQTSNVWAAVLAIIVLHVMLGLFIYRTFVPSKKQTKQD